MNRIMINRLNRPKSLKRLNGNMGFLANVKSYTNAPTVTANPRTIGAMVPALSQGCEVEPPQVTPIRNVVRPAVNRKSPIQSISLNSCQRVLSKSPRGRGLGQ